MAVLWSQCLMRRPCCGSTVTSRSFTCLCSKSRLKHQNPRAALRAALLHASTSAVTTADDGVPRSEEFLPVICEYGVFTPEELDEHGQTLLHRLCEMAEAQDSEEGGGEGGDEEGGLPAGAAMLDALLTTRPDVHLFAPNKSGLTALCWAKSTSDCARMLFHATLRALSRSTVSIVFSRRDGHLFSDYAHHLSEEIETAFPGLTAAITPMFDMKPGEEGCNGSFEVLWEGDGWMRTKLLGSRLATGKLPLLPNIILAILQHLLGPAAPQEALASRQEALLAHGAVLRGAVAVPRSISSANLPHKQLDTSLAAAEAHQQRDKSLTAAEASRRPKRIIEGAAREAWQPLAASRRREWEQRSVTTRQVAAGSQPVAGAGSEAERSARRRRQRCQRHPTLVERSQFRLAKGAATVVQVQQSLVDPATPPVIAKTRPTVLEDRILQWAVDDDANAPEEGAGGRASAIQLCAAAARLGRRRRCNRGGGKVVAIRDQANEERAKAGDGGGSSTADADAWARCASDVRAIV